MPRPASPCAPGRGPGRDRGPTHRPHRCRDRPHLHPNPRSGARIERNQDSDPNDEDEPFWIITPNPPPLATTLLSRTFPGRSEDAEVPGSPTHQYRGHVTHDFPRRKAVTRGFRLGAPRTVSVSPDGTRLLYLRSTAADDPVNDLWSARFDDGHWHEQILVDAHSLLTGVAEDLPAEERARRERLREVSAGITGYSVASDWTMVAFVLSGQLWVSDLADGHTRQVGSAGSFANPLLSPDGSRLAATSGPRVMLIDTATGSQQTLLNPDGPGHSWGSAEFIAAEEMNRFAGMWWSPAGDRLLVTAVDENPVHQWWIADPARPDSPATSIRYPAAGTPNARVRLCLVDMAGHHTDVPWDQETYPYLARARWDEDGIVLAVQDRAQRNVVTLAVSPLDGATTVLAHDHDSDWVELIPGAPRLTSGGLAMARVDRDADTRRLVLLDEDGDLALATPDGLQLHSIAADDDDSITFVGSEGDYATSDLWCMTWDGTLTRLSEPGGWSSGTARGGTTVIARADLSPGSSLIVSRDDTTWTIPSHAEQPPVTIRPQFLTDAHGWSNIAVLWPTEPHDEPLPVLMSPYGGPHAQRSIRAAAGFATEQWLADQGFCVVVADGPGSPSSPSNEFAIHHDLAGPTLAGQVTALERVLAAFPGRVDPERVAIRGWSFGGYLSALAVLARPDLFHVAVAGAPVTDWHLYDTHYTERYLGTPQDNPEAYERSDLIPLAGSASPRPILLVHGLADDNVVAAHTLRLSSALLAAGVAHTVLPLTGVTHMTPQEVVAENLLRLELQFLQANLS